ncbi:hypothetical protein CLAIMM_00036 [Cladophialophora immunda]|nr:hypothetical protein CLAIMM_00036 [Cladophialophora immunda]
MPPPMRIPLGRLAQPTTTLRAFSSATPGALRRPASLHFHGHHVTHHHAPLPLPHAASQRILSKASQTARTHWATLPEAIRDVTSYLALGALTSEAAFLVYCWDQNADLTDFLAV